MARSAAWICGFVCLAFHTRGVFGRDGEDEEYFPLSGGVATGVRVSIKAKKASGANAKIDFLTPDRSVAFRFWINRPEGKVSRSSEIGDVTTVDFGGIFSDAELDTDFVLDFYKEYKSFAVSFNGLRFPWFDFEHKDFVSTPITHVSVHSGFEDVEVVQRRPKCTTECHPSECMKSGASVCTDGPCYTKLVDTFPKCFSSQETGTDTAAEAHSSCCDGGHQSIGFGAMRMDDNKWIKVVDDAAWVKRVCDAFGTGAGSVLPDNGNCEDWVGKKGKLTAVSEEDGNYHVWVPASKTKRHPLGDGFAYQVDTIFKYPPWALELSAGPQREFHDLEDGKGVWESSEFDADGRDAIIYRTGVSSDTLQGKEGYFIDIISFVSGGKERWYEYSRSMERNIPLLSSKRKRVRLAITDEDTMAAVNCLEDRPFVDQNNNTCAVYTQNQWCDRHGNPSNEWCETYGTHDKSDPDQCSFARGGADNSGGPGTGYTPEYQCCSCGGGRHPPPPEAPTEAPEQKALMFQ